MLELNYSYDSCVKNSEKVSWKVDEVMPQGSQLDFTKRFLPEALSGGVPLSFLSEDERLKLNQIMGHAYVNLFLFVEEYIIAQILQHAHAEIFGDHHALRALSRFADEELKHQQLFVRYLDAFTQSFGSPCGVLANAAVVAGVILEKSPAAVMMTTYHLEIMTQAHYTECIKDDANVDPLFAKLFHAHWIEESQHARIDALELDKLVSDMDPEMLKDSFDEYLGLIDAFDGLLLQQSQMDCVSFKTATKRNLTPEQEAAMLSHQHAGYRRTFLTYGMTHPTFKAVLAKISVDDSMRVAAKATTLEKEKQN